MRPFGIRTFQGRIFLAILVVVLVPAALAVAGGVFTLQSIGDRSGTLGAWDTVAESGRELLDALDSMEVQDPELLATAEEHREALSESVRLSRVWSFVADRFLTVLPLAALIVGVLIAALALFTARQLSTGFGRPVAELVGWTERIAREEALPPESLDPKNQVEELDALRTALRRMADDLEKGRSEAIQAAQMRSWADLARRVAHEIKNPLTPMRMAASTLARDKSGAEAEAASVLLDEIARLDDMARTFSQYGRMPEGPKSEVDIGELLESLANQHTSGDVPVTVECAPGIRVDAHFDALQRAVRNLVLNAVEVLEGGGHIRLLATSDEDQVSITVQDNGPGIPDELLDDVWRPDVTTKRHGTGLGLAIVRQTVSAHGGTVEAANPPAGGAAFTLRIPRRSEQT